jgi:N-sulfoglucosamine sulfohydrolase
MATGIKPFNESPKYPFANTRAPEVLAEDMRTFITQKESPFFMYFATFEPHAPYYREGSDTINPENIIVPEHLPDVPAIREELAKYYMSTQRADKVLLKLTQILKETGQWENTIILFTSDNGRPFPGAKVNLYEPGIKLPFVFRNPFQSKQNVVTDAMISFTDITPTLLDFAGVDISKYGFHGRSFKSQLDKEKSVGFDTIYASHTFHEIQM